MKNHPHTPSPGLSAPGSGSTSGPTSAIRASGRLLGPLLCALAATLLVGPTSVAAQDAASGQATAPAPLTRAHLDELRETLEGHMARERRDLESLQRQVDVVTLYSRLTDVAWVDEVRFFGPPEEGEDEPRAISAFVFVPKGMDGPERGSLLVWQRGEDGLEIDSWADVPELRELLARGVTIVAPEYAGAPEVRLDEVPEYAQRRYPFLVGGPVEWRSPR